MIVISLQHELNKCSSKYLTANSFKAVMRTFRLQQEGSRRARLTMTRFRAALHDVIFIVTVEIDYLPKGFID